MMGMGGGIVFLLLAACRQDGGTQGTVVGNPGEASPQLARAVDATYEQARALIDFTDALACGVDISEESDVSAEADLLDGAPLVPIPGGTWCAIGVSVDALYVSGVTAEGQWFEIFLAPGFIEMEALRPLVVDGDRYVLELGEPDWLAPALEEGNGSVIFIAGDSPMGALLSDSLTLRSALFEDSDGDGVLSDEERALGPVAVGGSRSDSEDSGQEEGFPDTGAGGGCGGGQAALLLLLPALVWRRERERG